ncbi:MULTISPECIES: hypothetical protein [unclassified Enterococcus]|uniref:hypothetical protein n=1 Tax=unclassified Enterococcus TaxID=2608891 RepID=UPI0013ED7A4F|nr:MULTISPECIES: hypothetical protein [unclassified Enterococcus]
MKKKRKICWIIVFLSVLFPVSYDGTRVHAGQGALTINNQVIYEDQQAEEGGNEVSFAINDLFLAEKEAVDQQLKAKQKELVSAAQEKVFFEKPAEPEALDQKVMPYLFKEGTAVAPVQSTSSSAMQQMKVNQLVTFSGYVLGGSLCIGAGLFLGKQLTYHKNKRSRSGE